MTDLEILKKLTGESDDVLLSLLLSDAEEFVLSYTKRTELPDILKKTVRDLAINALNRMGTEGESGRSEGGESYSFDAAPKQIFDVLNRYRLIGVGGRCYEAKKKQTEMVQP
ncbi:MAG: phage head-tail connector protein [Lachnospiraceae bacterium]|nr:phage head-tail connector protein [Roseburia sp.]MBP3468269.1 phage head-tail connector protein [Lachnospiraceae bacterium]